MFLVFLMGQSASPAGRPNPALEKYRSGGLDQKDGVAFSCFFTAQPVLK